MSLSSPGLPALPRRSGAGGQAHPAPGTFGAAPIARAREYLFADGRRSIQTWLGLIWLLDGGLQLQSFMYGSGFIAALRSVAVGQPPWVADSVNWAATRMGSQQALLNTVSALLQIAIGLGLLHRRTVKPALALSFAWSSLVWWFGEGFGMVLMPMISPLSGAPGAAFLYLLVGLIAWPGNRAGGLLGVRGARLAWGALWLLMAWLWLAAPGTSPNAVAEAINGAPSGAGWLTSVQDWVSGAARGHGLVIGLTLAATSAAIAVTVVRNWHARAFLVLAMVINVVFWIVGQGFGGILAGGATDPNSAPLFVLLACALYALVPLSPEGADGRAAAGLGPG